MSTKYHATPGTSRMSVHNLVCNEAPHPSRQMLPSIDTLLLDSMPLRSSHNHGIRKRGASSGKGKRLWTPEEDEKLRRLAGDSPENWNVISIELVGRTGKQCRERWLNHLRPDIRKGGWTEEEDRIIIQEQRRHGNKWSYIARKLHGRSDNAVKNRYNATLKRQFPRG